MNGQRFVGVDYSSRKVSAVCIGDSAPAKPMAMLSFAAPKRVTGMMAMQTTINAYKDWAMEGWLLESSVVIETPIIGGNRNLQTGLMMAMTAGGLMQVSFHYGASSVEFAAPSSWKKGVCGDGALHKEQVARWLQQTHKGLFEMCSNDDDTDAACLALYAAMEED
jgi:hypothetical protein